MGIRSLTQPDATAARRFALLASFPPGRDLPVDALYLPHVQRWLQGWGDELGVGWEEDGVLRGAAWARRVEPALVRDLNTGEPLPEVIISVVDDLRRVGIGTQLMEALLIRAQAARYPGLSLAVSEHNPVALRLYDRVGFVRQGRTPSGLLIMVWRPRD